MNNWKTINDKDIRMIWRCTDSECECEKYDCIVDPTFYQDNGTPICMDGQDMQYIRTELADCSEGSVEHLVTVEEVCPYCAQRCFEGEGCDEWQADGFND